MIIMMNYQTLFQIQKILIKKPYLKEEITDWTKWIDQLLKVLSQLTAKLIKLETCIHNIPKLMGFAQEKNQ